MKGLLVFKFLWANIRPVMASCAKRLHIIKEMKHLDVDEKAVLREYLLQ